MRRDQSCPYSWASPIARARSKPAISRPAWKALCTGLLLLNLEHWKKKRICKTHQHQWDKLGMKNINHTSFCTKPIARSHTWEEHGAGECEEGELNSGTQHKESSKDGHHIWIALCSPQYLNTDKLLLAGWKQLLVNNWRCHVISNIRNLFFRNSW